MKNTVATMDDLSARIKELEALEATQMDVVKAQLVVVRESLKPSSLIKNSFKSIATPGGIKNTVISTSAVVAAGWMAKKLFVSNSPGIVRKILGYGLRYITTSVVTKKLSALREKKTAM
ncbi:MAG: hypothetical protein V4685_07215 [Bacteroidota bacterium]